MSFFDEPDEQADKRRLAEYEARNRRTNWRVGWGTFIVLMAIVLLSYAAMKVIGTPDFEPKVTQTSENTWHIYDPDNDPEKHISQTCATQGKKVVQLHTVGTDYSDLDVVCG